MMRTKLLLMSALAAVLSACGDAAPPPQFVRTEVQLADPYNEGTILSGLGDLVPGVLEGGDSLIAGWGPYAGHLRFRVPTLLGLEVLSVKLELTQRIHSG